ncbi:hypothetical protein [Vibrio europaeus]|uniref:hypothetical protein n=1 Tax=Vibrio europaeus TaxID=300876 RepID=UPI00233E6B5A|nr:hypothetical protein [Vibrio europaeus]MDC5854534.1 hypothetical protein [Vibrio europaeus]
MVQSDHHVLATKIIELLKDSNLSPKQQEEQLIYALEDVLLLSPDVQRSHLNAKQSIPTYRGHIYEQRLMDALACPDVGGKDISDLYLDESHPHFKNLVLGIYGAFGEGVHRYYCRTSTNGISIESKTSEGKTIEAPKVSGYLDCPFDALTADQQEQALDLCNKLKRLKKVMFEVTALGLLMRKNAGQISTALPLLMPMQSASVFCLFLHFC